jgi:hypothetical protein
VYAAYILSQKSKKQKIDGKQGFNSPNGMQPSSSFGLRCPGEVSSQEPVVGRMDKEAASSKQREDYSLKRGGGNVLAS